MPSALAIGLALTIAVAAAADPPPTPAVPGAPPAHETLAQVMARWKAFIEPLRNVPREVRVPESKKFFATIPWETLDYLCEEGSPGVGPDSAGMLLQIMTFRMQVIQPSTAEIATMVADHDKVIECRSPLVAWVVGHRDRLNAPERVQLASAFRTAATFPGLQPAYTGQLLVGTASLIATDSLMAGMMGWGRGVNPDTAGYAVRMLSQSVDPRAPDSLAALAREYAAAGSPRLDLPLIFCRGRCGELALPTFIATFEDSTATPERMVAGLEAAATVPTLPAAQAILGRYRDHGVIADSTFTAAGTEAGRYYGLWLATRIAEPHLTAWLRTGDESEAQTALELFDRSFRYGPADQDSLVTSSLGALAARTRGDTAQRAEKVRLRSLHPPNTGRPQLPPRSP
ncbi:MAG TPA: hypothetical protein VNM87_08745 [Candidatus Udaeobacter sp.]|nr:hypothetical protein [Candidatus Udaeobacter sp.]